MARNLKRLKGLLPLLVLAAVSLRVLTGAAEVQLNFTSLIIQEHKALGDHVDKESMLRGVVASNPTDASSIPDNLRTYATYKKYLTPDVGIHLPIQPPEVPNRNLDIGVNVFNLHSQKVVYQPTSHSPPADVLAFSHIHTTSAAESVNLENYFGEIAINNSVGGVGRL